MSSDLDTFRKGVSACRNARDWAKKRRDEIIKATNERVIQSQHLPTKCEPTSELAVAFDDHDTLTISDTEFRDTQLNFTHPNDTETRGR